VECLLLRQHVSALALGRHQVSNCVSEETIQCSIHIVHFIQLPHCIVSPETQFETWWWPSAMAETCCLSNKYSTTLLVVFLLYYLHHLIPVSGSILSNIWIILKNMYLSTTTNFIIPLNMCYMFRSYWPSWSIKYVIFRTQNKMHIEYI